jgi:hypothetical protein
MYANDRCMPLPGQIQKNSYLNMSMLVIGFHPPSLLAVQIVLSPLDWRLCVALVFLLALVRF